MTAEQPNDSIPPYQVPDDEEIGLIALARQNPAMGFALAAAALALLVFIAYLPSLRGEYTWLDNVSVTENPSMLSVNGLQRFWTGADNAGRYQPLTMTTFWLNFRAAHLNRVPYHFTSIVLNIIVAILLWVLLRRLKLPGAWVAAAAVALHPTHVQAVAWISSRGTVLASAFFLASLLVYLRYAGLTPRRPGEKTLLALPDDPGRLWGISLFLFACAILSDPTSATLPLVILLLAWWKRSETFKLVPLLPFFAVGIAGAGVAVWMQARSNAVAMLTAATGPVSVLDRLIDGGREIGFYAMKTIAPVKLMFDYGRWTLSPLQGAIGWAGVIVTLGLLFAASGKRGRGAFVAVALFVVLLLPSLGWVDPAALRYAFVADRLVYLAGAPLVVFIVSSLAAFIESPKQQELLGPQVAPVGAGILLTVLLVLTFRQVGWYSTNKALWRHEIDQAHNNPRSWLVANQYGGILMESHLVSDAESWFEKAHRIAPGDPVALFNLASVTRARAYEARIAGRGVEAAALDHKAADFLDQAVKLNPHYAEALVVIGDLLAGKKDDAGAKEKYEQAIAADPDMIGARLRYGGALRRLAEAQKDEAVKQNLLEQAENALGELLDISPNYAAAHTELGTVYMLQHKFQAEVMEYQTALQLDPFNTTVMLNFGLQLDSSGSTELAMLQMLAAAKINPRLQAAQFHLGRLQLQLGHRSDAVVSLSTAVELDPSDAKAKELLAEAKDAVAKQGPGTPTMPSAGNGAGARQPTSSPFVAPQ